MPMHGEMTVQFRITNHHGSDVVINREQALALYRALAIALQQPAPPTPKKGSK